MTKLDHDELISRSINLSETFTKTGNRKSCRQIRKALSKLHYAKQARNSKTIISAYRELAAILRRYKKLKIKRIYT